MRWNAVKALIPTLKEAPSDAEIVSHILMTRAGLIRKLSAGLYTYLPLCLKVIRKVEAIIREELNAKGAQELLMPFLQTRELWEKSGRWNTMGKEMVRFKNRQDRDFVLGPTHEEVITDLASKEVRSYRDLPCNFYQIQAKVRDEIRPRFGVIRAKEFIMKDAYSFHQNEECLDKTFKDMFEAYSNIFKRCGLDVTPVEADTGAMGGSASTEFIALSPSGEDLIAVCACGYAANIEKATSIKPTQCVQEVAKKMEEVLTPEKRTIEEVSEYLKIESFKMIKTLFYAADDNPVCVLLRGDDTVNEVKLKNHLKAVNLFLLDDASIEKLTGAPVGFAGPVGLKGMNIIADNNIKNIYNGVTGANKKDTHLVNVNIGRDYEPNVFVDISTVKANEICPVCKKGLLNVTNGIELGHIFKLGKKYTESMQAKYLDVDGKEKVMIMGCYGIGVSRMVAAIIEQHNDKDGIIWPESVSPFDVHLIAVQTNDATVLSCAEKIYNQLREKKIDVLFDDRDERPGIKFKDADLIGIPVRIVVSTKTLAENSIEIKTRKTGEVKKIGIEEVEKYIFG